MASAMRSTPWMRKVSHSFSPRARRVSSRLRSRRSISSPGAGDVGQVVGRHAEGPFEGAAPADEQAAEVVGLEEPLVGVEHQRVGQLDALQGAPAGLAERGRRAVRPVDVEPQALAAAQLRDLGKRIDRSRVRRAGVGHDEGGVRPAALSRRWRPPAPGAAGAASRLRGGRGRRRARSRAPRARGRSRRASRRRGSTRRARGSRRAAARAVTLAIDPPLAITPSVPSGRPSRERQPVERHELEGRGSRAAGPRCRDGVAARSEPVAEHAGERRRPGHAGEVARVVAVLHGATGLRRRRSAAPRAGRRRRAAATRPAPIAGRPAPGRHRRRAATVSKCSTTRSTTQ